MTKEDLTFSVGLVCDGGMPSNISYSRTAIPMRHWDSISDRDIWGALARHEVWLFVLFRF